MIEHGGSIAPAFLVIHRLTRATEVVSLPKKAAHRVHVAEDTEMAKGRTHPEPYDFQIAAGAIDRTEYLELEKTRTIAVLNVLANMNGTYRTLDASFRADMRTALECDTDDAVKRICVEIADRCRDLNTLPHTERVLLRRQFSKLSHFWPEHPLTVLPPL